MQSSRYGMPSKEVQRSDQVSDISAQADESDLSANNLVYSNPDSLSLAVSRSTSRLFFQRASYNPGETAVIDINSGTDFADPANAYLTFSCVPTQATAAGTCTFGIGSAMNLIRQITIRSRSGVEIDRVERANVWSLFESQYKYPSSWFTTVGSATEGWGVTMANVAAATVNDTTNAGTRFCIPLARISSFFNGIKKGQKIPPQLLSGLHIEIIWETAATALFSVGNTTTSYSIRNLSLMMDVISMTDDVQKTINQQSANAGLEYAYPRIFTNPTTISSTVLNVQVRKAVSQANYSWAVSLNAANYNNIAVDSFLGIYDVLTYQWRLGALYYPLQPLSVNLLDGVEAYKQVLEVFGKSRDAWYPPNVLLADYVTNGKGILGVVMEKDQAMDCSGLPVNNSRVLELQATYGTAVSNREVLVFLDYNSVCRSYVDNTSVSI